MSIHIACDRCGAVDDPHMRRVDMSLIDNTGATYQDWPDHHVDLCGPCFTRLRDFLQPTGKPQ